MRVLALDTTTRPGSVAFVEDGGVQEVRCGDESRTHAERLPSEVVGLLDGVGATLASIDVFAVAVGPGSFTGIRIGIATIQGLALATGRPVVTASALELLALAASAGRPPGTLVGSWMNGYRGEVFSALYRLGDQPILRRGALAELDPPRVGLASVVLGDWAARFDVPTVLVGEGAELYARQAAPGVEVHPVSALAGLLGRVASLRASEGAWVHPAGIQPVYVRRPDVEVTRDRAAATAPAHEGRTT